MRPDVAGYLRDFPEVFLMEPNGVTGEVEKVELSHSVTTFTERTNKVEEVLQKLREKDAFLTLEGWRNEVTDRNYSNVITNKEAHFLITKLGSIPKGILN